MRSELYDFDLPLERDTVVAALRTSLADLVRTAAGRPLTADEAARAERLRADLELLERDEPELVGCGD